MFEQEHEQFLPDATRAAVVVETADGKRMIYEMVAPVKLLIEAERSEFDPWSPQQRQLPQVNRLTFSGIFKGGKIWTSEMPGDAPQEIESPPLEIEG